MEPPLRIRALQLSHLPSSTDRSKVTHHDTGLATVLRRRKDSPVDSEYCRTTDTDGQISKSPRHRRKPSKALIEQQRHLFLRLILGPSVSERNVYSPAAFRESLFGGFVNDLTWMQAMPSRYLVLQQLRSYFEGGRNEGPMTAATEALLLAQFSVSIQDAQYIAEARRRYGLAMSRCARILAANPRKLGDWIEALAAIQALGTCEMYDDLSQGDEVWIRHSDGMLAILRHFSLRTEDLADGYLKTVIYNAVDASLKTAVWARKPSVFAEQRWLDFISVNCEGRGWCLQHIVCRLPTLLCQMDALSLPDRAEQDAVDVLKELLTIERDLLRWLHEWYVSYQDMPIRTRQVQEFPDFVHQHKDALSMFPKAFDFPSPVEAHGHLIYYDWLNIVRQAICDIHTRLQCSVLISDVDRERAFRNATECADAACMLAPYSAQMEKMEPSKALMQVLGLAEEWYEKTEQKEKLQYVQSILGDEAKHAEDHRILRWQDVNGFLVRRVLMQHCIGPPTCVLQTNAWIDTT